MILNVDNQDDDVAISITNQSFSWGVKIETEKKKSKKEMKLEKKAQKADAKNQKKKATRNSILSEDSEQTQILDIED